MKTKIEVTEFGKIVEEIPTCKFDCAMTHIYLNNLGDDAIDYLYFLASRLPAEQLQSYMIHLNGETENLLGFLEIWLIKLLIYKIERTSVKISASGGQIFGKVLVKIKTKII